MAAVHIQPGTSVHIAPEYAVIRLGMIIDRYLLITQICEPVQFVGLNAQMFLFRDVGIRYF